jgi:hypothetical protein
MKITKRQLKRIIKEEKAKRLQEGALQDVNGDSPVFHDVEMDEALNAYVEKYVMYLEDDIGESRATLALLEVMKDFLVTALERGTNEALKDAGVHY